MKESCMINRSWQLERAICSVTQLSRCYWKGNEIYLREEQGVFISIVDTLRPTRI